MHCPPCTALYRLVLLSFAGFAVKMEKGWLCCKKLEQGMREPEPLLLLSLDCLSEEIADEQKLRATR